MLTYIPVSEIKKYEIRAKEEINVIKEILAYEITKLVHGEYDADKARETAKQIFSGNGDTSNMPTEFIEKESFIDSKIDIISLLVNTSLAPSKKEARRLIEQGGITLNGEKISDFNYEIKINDFSSDVVIKKGKKIYKKILLK